MNSDHQPCTEFRIVRRNGVEILHVFYDRTLDNFDESIERAYKFFGAKRTRHIQVLCRPKDG